MVYITSYSYYNYEALGFIIDDLPDNKIMLIEVNSTTLYNVRETGANTSRYIDKSDDKGETWANVIDRGVDRDIISYWYDRDNGYLYFLEMDWTDQTDLYVFYIDLSDDSENNVGGAIATNNDGVPDLWIRDGNLEVIYRRVTFGYYIIMRWGGAVWATIDTSDPNGYDSAFTRGIIIETDAYIAVEDGTVVTMLKFNGAVISELASTSETTSVPRSPFGGSYYDDSNAIYTVLTIVGGDEHLYSYSISGNSWIQGALTTLDLVLDRAYDSSANPPFAKPRGYTSVKIYQVPAHFSGRFNLVSAFPFSDDLYSMTPHFAIDASKNIYELVDKIDSVVDGIIYHSRQNYPVLEMSYNSDELTITAQMFIQIIGNYTANDSNRIFYGTYNFKDEEDGTTSTDIEFIDLDDSNVDCDIDIISSLDGHRKVLRWHDHNGAGDVSGWNNFTSGQAAGIVEFYWRASDASKENRVLIYDGTTIGPFLHIYNELFQYRAGGGPITSTGITALDDTWYHLKIDFDCSTDTYDLYIDGVFVDNYGFWANCVELDRIRILSSNTPTDYYSYFDAFGYSWDEGYNVGDNRYAEEGEPDQVIFEGIASNPTKGRIQFTEVIGLGSEMNERKPNGSKTGRSDQIITDINNDGAPNGPEYIRDGVLSEGNVMGTLIFTADKIWKKVVDDLAEHDGFTWALRPQGDLDYNNGSIDTKAFLRFDGSTYSDTIVEVKSWKVAKLNQIIVNGAIDKINDKLYSGQWDDLEDQQSNGINPITIEDANLNTDTLCQAKADNMGANETERTRVRFKFKKVGYGFLQPSQTILFKYVVANYMTISEALYILDKIIMNIKTEAGYAEISSEL